MQIHPIYREPRRRAELLTLLDAGFSGLAAKIDAARALGFDWDTTTTPFVDRIDDRIVSHVGVLDVPLRLGDAAVRVAGIHAVCTRPGYRRRGHYRRAMEQALRFVDQRWERAQLFTSDPALYVPFGFRVIPTVRWQVPRARHPLDAYTQPLDPLIDLPALLAALSRRTPVSHAYASMDDGWLFGIDAVLATSDLSLLRWVPDLDVLIAGRLEGERFTLYDVVATELPPWPELCERLPGAGPIELAFTPDRFPGADVRVVEPADYGCYMVRGPFPHQGRDFAVPPLAQH